MTTDATGKSTRAIACKISCRSGGDGCTDILCAGSVGQRAAHGIQSLDTVHCLLGPVCAVPPGTSGHHHRFGHLVGKICRPAKGTTCRGFGIVAHDRFIYGHHCGVGCGSALEREPGNGGLRFGFGRSRGRSWKSVRSVEEIPKEIATPRSNRFPGTPSKLCPVSVALLGSGPRKSRFCMASSGWWS